MNKLERSKKLEEALMSNMRHNRGLHKFRKTVCGGLGFAELSIVKLIVNRATLAPNEIAKEFDTTAAAVTHHINSLEEKGYIIRKVSKTDKRVKEILPTAKARRAVKHANLRIGKFTEFSNDLMDFLGPKDTDNLIRLVKRFGEFKQEQISKEKERWGK
jgi:DNA-binding MarR family transcriptional regulator